MSPFSMSHSFTAAVQRRSLRSMIALSAAVAAVFVSMQALPSATASTPGGSNPGAPSGISDPFGVVVGPVTQVLLDADDSFNPAAVLNNEAIFLKHAWEPISSSDSTG